jgi:maltodextrin utilization protein YvdJ
MLDMILFVLVIGFAFIGFLGTFIVAFVYCMHTYYEWQFKRSRDERY